MSLVCKRIRKCAFIYLVKCTALLCLWKNLYDKENAAAYVGKILRTKLTDKWTLLLYKINLSAK